jgi:hypothetical protein
MEPVFGKLGRHKMGEKPRVPGNIGLLQLPCYSPGLSPVELSPGPDYMKASGGRGHVSLVDCTNRGEPK